MLSEIVVVNSSTFACLQRQTQEDNWPVRSLQLDRVRVAPTFFFGKMVCNAWHCLLGICLTKIYILAVEIIIVCSNSFCLLS